MSKIVQVKAIQIFDSRGTPTISCKVILDNGMEGIAMVPSGASTGSKEALELRDREIKYHGKGVVNEVNNINNIHSNTRSLELVILIRIIIMIIM